MRYGRHLRHRRHSRHERWGTKLRENAAGPLTVSIPATLSVATGAALNIAGTVTGGLQPLTYAWKKGSTAVGGNTPTYNVPAAAAGNAGSYTLTVTDAAGKSVTSNACAVTVTA